MATTNNVNIILKASKDTGVQWISIICLLRYVFCRSNHFCSCFT